MTPDLPAWTEFDPGATLPLPGGSAAGRVVAMVAGPGAVEAGWAADVALALAGSWGPRVVIADAGLEGPSLGRAAGIPASEGLSDFLLWGASVQRVMRPLPGGGFVVPAGTAVAHGATALAEARWGTLCDGFREAGVAFVVLVPSAESGLDAVVAASDDVILLATPDEDPELLLASGADKVRATLGRTEAAAVPEPGTAALPEAGADPSSAASTDAVADEELQDEPLALDDPAAWDFSEPEPDPESAASEAGTEEPVGAFGAFPLDEFDTADEEDLWDVPDPSAGDVGVPGPTELDDLPSEEPAPDALAPDELAPDDLGSPATADPDDLDDLGFDDRLAADPLLTAPPAMARPGPDAEPALEMDPLDRVLGAPSFEEIVEESRPAAEPRSPGRRTALLVILLLLVAALAVAAWMGWVQLPGITPSSAAVAPPTTTAPPVAAAPAVVTAPVQGFSVALGAYQDGAVAANTAAEMAQKVPGVLFITAPVEVNGAAFVRVLAGPAEDSAAAEALSARVASVSGADGSMWVARATPRAFQLGEMSDLDAARRRADVLQGLGVPAYVLAVDYDDGSVRYRVYAGAYADEAEAAYLSGLLQERGLSTATLSDRIGRLPE